MKVLIFKLLKKIISILFNKIEKFYCIFLFWSNDVKYQNFTTSGIPYVMVARKGSFKIGKCLAMNNGIKGNPIGCYSKCTFFVNKGASLTIGNDVGVSQTAIICHDNIVIGDKVKIGGGVKIYDTDFHSLDPVVRASKEDQNQKKTAAVFIEDNVFIGAYSIILKGLTIGENSIIGAGSIVTKSVPKNQIWAGSPAKFIKEILL
jgi:acetyltransferase-like isoleucine patch superfamily enzyme